MYGGYDGGQAENARVPYADYGPRIVPENLTDEQVILTTTTSLSPPTKCISEYPFNSLPIHRERLFNIDIGFFNT